MSKLTGRELALLERAFAAEIDSAMAGRPPVMRTRAKLAGRLVEAGLLMRAEATMGGGLPVKVAGYMLTEAGRLAYCQAAGGRADG